MAPHTNMANMARSVLVLLLVIIQSSMAFSFSDLFPRDTNNNSQPVNLGAPDAATFVTQFGNTNGNLSFTITATNLTSGDIWFRMSGSTYWSWIAVGIGNQMAGSLMFIAYQGSSNTAILSGRLATDHHEPTYSKSVNISQFSNALNSYGYKGDPILNGVQGNMMYVTGICYGCQNLTTNKLSTSNTKQQFIYAAGPPGRNPNSNALDAPLRKHAHHGSFTMDLTKAIGLQVPPMSNSSSSGTVNGGDRTDYDYGESGHAFFMLLAVMIVFPLGFFLVAVLQKTRLHMLVQSFGLALILLGFGFGCYITTTYNRTMHFNSAHQIIGVLLVLAFSAQWVFGFLSHRHYMKTGFPLQWALKPHKHGLGTGAFVIAMINATLGLNLALASKLNILYWPIMAFILILLCLSYIFKGWFQKRWGGKDTAMAAGGAGFAAGGGAAAAGSQQYGISPGRTDGLPAGYQAPGTYGGVYGQSPWGTRSDIALENMHAGATVRRTELEANEPPPYDLAPTKPREFA